MAQNRTGFAHKIHVCALSLGIATAASSALFIATRESLLLTLAITFGTSFYHFAMRLAVGAVIPQIRNTDDRHFSPRRFEAGLYAFLRVKHWKKHMPTYDPRLFSPECVCMEQILQNSCRAEVIHEVIMLLSFLPMLAIPALGAPVVFIATSVAAALFDSLFVIIQRYNRPRLKRIVEKERNKR